MLRRNPSTAHPRFLSLPSRTAAPAARAEDPDLRPGFPWLLRRALPLLALLLLPLAPPAVSQIGSLDPAFGSGGIVVTDLEQTDRAYGVGVADDGRVFVAGYTEGSAGPTAREALLVRYLADGTLDQEWRYNHIQFGCGDVPEAFWGLSRHPAGGFVGAGFAQYDCSGGARDFWTVELGTNGSDDLFERPVFAGFADDGYESVVQPDGRIVTIGYGSSSSAGPSSRDVAFVRHNADGTLDESGFGSFGETLVDIAGDFDLGRGLALRSDGKIIGVASATVTGQGDVALVRLESDGTLDTSFGTGGAVILDYFGFQDRAYEVALQPDGEMVLAGFTRQAEDGDSRLLVARYLPDGSPDTGFATDGVFLADLDGLPAAGRALEILPNGKIVVAGDAETGAGGRATRDLLILRLNPDGTLDPTFSGDGIQTADSLADERDIALDLAVDDDGDMVVAGFTEYEVDEVTHQDLLLARFLGEDLTIFDDGFESGDVSAWDGAIAR